MTGENTGDNPRRVLLKLSGEAFGGGKVGIDTSVIRRICLLYTSDAADD